jgi:hypothetical protein
MGKKASQKATGRQKQASRNKPQRKLTVKQQRFIDAYAGDIKEAAQKAELSYDYARKLVTKRHILEAIQNRQETEVRPKDIADRQERQAFWTKIMRDGKEETKDQLKASELLGKSEADFTENLSHRFPEGCGVLVIGGDTDPEKWKRQSQAHHANGSGNAGHTG